MFLCLSGFLVSISVCLLMVVYLCVCMSDWQIVFMSVCLHVCLSLRLYVSISLCLFIYSFPYLLVVCFTVIFFLFRFQCRSMKWSRHSKQMMPGSSSLTSFSKEVVQNEAQLNQTPGSIEWMRLGYHFI